MTPEFRRRLIDLLETIEVVSTAALGDDQCPYCGPPGRRHEPDCELAACLEILTTKGDQGAVERWRAYCKLLCDELNEVVPLMMVHFRSWKSTRFEQGVAMRQALGIDENCEDLDEGKL